MKLVYKFLLPTVIVLGIGFYLLIDKTVSSKNEVVDMLQKSSKQLLKEQLEQRQNRELKMQNKFLDFSASSIANLSGNFIDNYDKEGLAKELKYYFNINSVKAVTVFDDLSKSYFLTIVKTKEGFVVGSEKFSGGPYKVIRKSMLFEGEASGFVELFYDESHILDRIKKTKNILDTTLADFTKQVEQKKSESKKEELNTVLLILVIVISIISLLSYFVVNKPLYILKHGLDDFFLFLQNKKDNTKKIDLDTNDEFGAMANSLNENISVSAKLHEEIHELNTNLEKRIEEKTQKVTTLLDNAGQGFLTFNEQFIVDDEYSKECEKLLGADIAYKDISNLLFNNKKEKIALFKDTLTNALNEKTKIKRNAYISLLPSIILLNKKAVKLEYKILEEEKFMLILTNITSQKKLERKIKKEQEILKMVVAVVSESHSFCDTKNEYQEFISSYKEKIDFSKTPLFNISNMYRAIHTFKGSFSQLYMQDIVDFLHDLESEISKMQKETTHTNEDLLELLENSDFKTALENTLVIIKEILGSEFLESDNYLKIDISDISKLQEKIEMLLEHNEHTTPECEDILCQVQNLSSQKLYSLLHPFAASTLQLAERLEKEIYEFDIIGDAKLSIPEHFKPFVKSFVHLFRNCVDHGIENPETRALMGKDEKGTISCSFEQKDQYLVIAVSDDGAGIDKDKLKEKLEIKGIESKGLEDDEIYGYIFNDNISTKEQVSDISGRGVGMAAVKGELERLNGKVKITSQKNIGTTFEFMIPIT